VTKETSLDIEYTITNLGAEPATQSVTGTSNQTQFFETEVSLDPGEETTETATYTPDSDAIGPVELGVESENDIDTKSITVAADTGGNGGSGGGGGTGGGGGGGAGPPDEPELDVEFFEDATETTIRLYNIPRSSSIDIDTEGTLQADGVELTAFAIDFQFDPADFRIEATKPTDDPPSVESLPDTVDSSVGYLDFDVIGLDPSRVSESTVTFSIDSEQLPSETTSDALAVYQYVDGEWTELESEQTDVGVTATLADIHSPPIALGLESDSTSDDESTEESSTDDGTDSEESSSDDGTDSDESSEESSADDSSDDNDLSNTSSDEDTDDSDVVTSVPGFGVTVGLISLVSILVLLRNRGPST